MEQYDCKCDIWSLGCVIYEMATLNPPFLAKSIHQLKERAIKGQYTPIPSNFSRNLQEVVSKMLIVNPKIRWSAEQLLEHPSFKDPVSSTPHGKLSKTHSSASQGKASCLKEDHIINKIKVPKNLAQLNDLLPQKQYSSEEPEFKQMPKKHRSQEPD